MRVVSIVSLGVPMSGRGLAGRRSVRYPFDRDRNRRDSAVVSREKSSFATNDVAGLELPTLIIFYMAKQADYVLTHGLGFYRSPYVAPFIEQVDIHDALSKARVAWF